MTSPFRKALCALTIALGSTSIALAQSNFFEVSSTPYDHQMQRIEGFLNAPTGYAVYAPSLDAVNGWMTSLRMMPYQYSHQWRTPYEIRMDGVGDCKGKALALYRWMRERGASNLSLVIGKRRVEDARTHAWLEWETNAGTFLLDPTFNWSASIKMQDPFTYVAYYGYSGGHKYRAGNSLLANRTLATRNPSAPAHGTIARTTQSTYPLQSTSWPVYQQQGMRNLSQVHPASNVSQPVHTTITPTAVAPSYLSYSNSWAACQPGRTQNGFQTRAASQALRPPQSEMHNFRRSVNPQRKPITHTVRYNQLARPAFVQSRPVTKQGWAEPQLFIQH